MKQNKLLIGAVTTMLVFGTGAAVSANETDGLDGMIMQSEDGVMATSVDVLYFDEANLPDGIQFAEKVSSEEGEDVNSVQSISTDGVKGVITVDENNLPEGVQFAVEISLDENEKENIVQSITIELVEGTLTFDETNLPKGVHFATEGTNNVADGVMNVE